MLLTIFKEKDGTATIFFESEMQKYFTLRTDQTPEQVEDFLLSFKSSLMLGAFLHATKKLKINKITMKG